MNFNDIFKSFNNFDFITFNIITCSITYFLIFLLLLKTLSLILVSVVILIDDFRKNKYKKK